MLKKRIIPCLDIKNGRTVKGIHFEEVRDAGDPVELAQRYVENGADELVFLDITATNEKRRTLTDLVSRISEKINIPFTVGGGISSVEDAKTLLRAGADKVSINSSAILVPELISLLASELGSQCVVVAMDVKPVDGEWKVFSNGGRHATGLDALCWAEKAAETGAGEILLTSIQHDGTAGGFALDITKSISEHLAIPVIASGGAGSMDHFADVFTHTSATGVLAASVFHYGDIQIPDLKKFLTKKNIPVRTWI